MIMELCWLWNYVVILKVNKLKWTLQSLIKQVCNYWLIFNILYNLWWNYCLFLKEYIKFIPVLFVITPNWKTSMEPWKRWINYGAYLVEYRRATRINDYSYSTQISILPVRIHFTVRRLHGFSTCKDQTKTYQL